MVSQKASLPRIFLLLAIIVCASVILASGLILQKMIKAGSSIATAPTASSDKNNVAPENKLKFETILKGGFSEIAEQKNIVISDQSEWGSMRLKVGIERSSPLPEVDFGKEMLVAAFSGEKPTGGYDIEIQRIVENKNNINVFVQESMPGNNCILTEALTRPYHIIKIVRSEKKVDFVLESVVKDCN